MILEDVQKKLKSIKTLSKSNWIIGIFQFILLILCFIFYSFVGPLSWIFFLIFIWCWVATIVMNIIIAVKSSNDGIIISQNIKEMSIKQTFSTNMILAIISIFLISWILNIIIFVKTKNVLMSLETTESSNEASTITTD